MALKMAEMTAFLNKRQAEDDRVQQLIQDAFKELNKYVMELLFPRNLTAPQNRTTLEMSPLVSDNSPNRPHSRSLTAW